jgi:hypothetical protein
MHPLTCRNGRLNLSDRIRPPRLWVPGTPEGGRRSVRKPSLILARRGGTPAPIGHTGPSIRKMRENTS